MANEGAIERQNSITLTEARCGGFNRQGLSPIQIKTACEGFDEIMVAAFSNDDARLVVSPKLSIWLAKHSLLTSSPRRGSSANTASALARSRASRASGVVAVAQAVTVSNIAAKAIRWVSIMAPVYAGDCTAILASF